MSITLWIAQAVLAAAFAAAGLMKLTRTRQVLVDKGMDWAGGMTDGAVKGIGAVELLGAIGLIAPAVTGTAPVLTPLAAIGLVLVMIGAVAFHVRRSEFPNVATNVFLAAVAVFIAWGRFGTYAL